MAISAARVTVATTAVALNTASSSGQVLLITNGSAAVDLGDDTVASGAGYEVAASGTVTVDIKPGDVLYAICGTTSDVQVLRT